MKIRKLLLTAQNLMRRARKHRELRRFRSALSVGTALAVTAPLALHAPAEAAHIRVEEGMRGAVVQHVQELLIKAGYLAGAADGVAGPLTRAAIEACQKEHGLTVDGIWRPTVCSRVVRSMIPWHSGFTRSAHMR